MKVMASTNKSCTKNTGFSLLELLTVLSILLILISISLPPLDYLVSSSRSDVAIQKIFRLYNFARSEAVTRNQSVYFCGSNSGLICEKKWHKFALIFIDIDKDKRPSTNEIIRLESIALTQGYVESRVAFGLNYTLISGQGTAKYLGSMVYCSEKKEPSLYRRLTWNRTGRPYLGTDQDHDSIIEGTNGEALDC